MVTLAELAGGEAAKANASEAQSQAGVGQMDVKA